MAPWRPLAGGCACLLLLLALACGAPPESRDLKFALWGTQKDVSIYRNLIADFQTRQPGVGISPVFIPWGNYYTKLQLLIVGHVAPDVVMVPGDLAYELQHNGQIVNLQPFIERERATDPQFMQPEAYDLEPTKPLATFDGNYYYVPVGPMTMNLYYNKTLFDQAGVPYPNENWTWDDLRAAAIKLTRRDASGRVEQWGFVVENWWQWWLPFLWQNEAALFDDMTQPRKCLLDQPAAIETFTFLKDLALRDGCAPTPMQKTQMNGDFMTGKVAMQIHGSWMVEQFRTLKAFQWDMAPLPRRRQRANIVTVAGYAITAQCPRPERAWLFVREFMRPQAQRLMCDDCTLWIPSHRGVIAENPMGKVSGVPAHHALRYDEVHRARPGVIRHPSANRILNAVGMGLDPLFTGKRPPEQCLREVTAKVDAILSEPAGTGEEEQP